MSHRVNPEGFRLGTSRFWKSELFSSYIANFTQKFLGIYLLLKKKLDSFFFKIIFFKIVFLKGQKTLILVNVYKTVRRLINSDRGPGKPRKTAGRGFPSTKVIKLKTRLRRSRKLKYFLSKKFYPTSRMVPPVWGSLRLRKGLFRANWADLILVGTLTERFLEKQLFFPVEVRLKNIFSLKKGYPIISIKKPISLLSLCRVVYKKAKTFWQLKSFLYLKDAINILSLAFFYQKSGLLAQYIADIVKLRRKFLFDLKKLKSLLPYFKKHYFLIYGASLKINVLGKIFGQRKRRFRCFSLSEGLKFSTQDIRVNLSYSLAHTWNVFGSFGVKVWIFKTIVKNVGRL